MRMQAVITLFDDLAETELVAWVERRWVRPSLEGNELVFHDIDIARVRLIHDLRRDMAVPEETLPLVLSLLDQVHTLHGTLAAIADVLADQPPEVREILRIALERRRG